MAKLEDLCFAK